MRLYTCQNVAIAEKIDRLGRHTCIISESPHYREDDGFREAYDWLAKALAKRVKKPVDATHPIWAYAKTPEGYDYHSQGSEGEQCVYYVLEIPDDQVVGIDPVKWSSIYTDGFVYPPDIDDDEYERLCEKYKNASKEELEANRARVFDIDEGNIPEMVFWAIDAANIVSATRYICHLSTK